MTTRAAGRVRPRERPGPGRMPESLLRAVDLVVQRRVEALLPGDHLARSRGRGSELDQIRPYQPGDDDVRLIDWNVTARLQEPHVRVPVAERVPVTWLVLDASPSMHFGTADRRKADVAEGIALVVAHIAARRRGRLGVVTFGDGAPRVVAPRLGHPALLKLLAALREEPPADGTGRTLIGEALSTASLLARRRGAVAIVSDFRGPRDWHRPLVRLAAKHDVVAIEICDPREHELVDIGHLCLVDPETHRQVRVDTRSRRLRDAFRAASRRERDAVARDVRSAGAHHVRLSTSGDWLRVLAGALRKRPAR